MIINVSGENLEINETHDQLVYEKLDKQLEKYLHSFNTDMKIADVHIKKRPRWGYKVNFSMTLPGKKRIYAYEIDDDLSAALRKLRSDVERQIKEYRGKIGADNKTNTPLKYTIPMDKIEEGEF